MANDTLPMHEMFDTCYQILAQRLEPIHYAELTRLALASFGVSEREIHWQRQIEDIREKMLEKGYRETFYIGKPLCLSGIRWWFESEQNRLFHPTDGVWIPGSASCGADGAFEALMRSASMLKKTDAPLARVFRSRANGLVLEKHVANWFKVNWPMFYLPPDNEGKWEIPCDHDFKLKVGDKIYKVDVTGPRRNGTYGNPGSGKRRVDFHLPCKIIDDNVLWHSVLTGNRYSGTVHPEFDGLYPERMIVWLNCKKAGLDYEAIRSGLKKVQYEVAQ